jgi:hypothetical protein
MMIQEENLLKYLERLMDSRITQTGKVVNSPIKLLKSIASIISNVRRELCSLKPQPELTRYCKDLKKVETRAKELIDEFNGIIGNLDLGNITAEEVPGAIASKIGTFLDEKSTENVLFRLKNIKESRRNMR